MAGTRVSGMFSGMDTESLVQQLVEARRTKVTKATKDQSRVKYKQEAWDGLNKKIKGLFSTISNLRFESSFSKKATSVSNENAVSVITSDSAMNATQSLKVTKLAKAGYMTGAKISADDGNGHFTEKVTSATKLSDLGISTSDTLSIKVGDKTTDIEITEDMTLDKLTSKLANAGVDCKFDPSQQRIYIGSKDTGLASDFEISGSAMGKLGLDANNGAIKKAASNAEIVLNGATYYSSSNTFDINGLTITAKAETGEDEVTLVTSKDTSATYDMIKKFIKEYSDIINEMDKLYNASTKIKYDPLTDEEKSAMSDFEVEKWENGLKDQILAKDENISSVSAMLKKVMNSGFKVGNTTMHLFDFGIENAGYFNAADNEKNAFHIKGDEDDSIFSGESNKLKEMIASNPDAVTQFFNNLSKELYSTMDKMSSRIDGTRSYGSYFDDQKLKTDYNDYQKKVNDLETKLADYEDKWYAKFSKMETAMAKMQSNSNAVTGMFSGR